MKERKTEILGVTVTLDAEPFNKEFAKKDTDQVFFILSSATIAVRRLEAPGSKNNLNVATVVITCTQHLSSMSF